MASAELITNFRMVEALTDAPSPYPIEAWVLVMPEGLAIGLRNTQPAIVRRTYGRSERDQDAQVDRITLMIDYEGDGRIGYN